MVSKINMMQSSLIVFPVFNKLGNISMRFVKKKLPNSYWILRAKIKKGETV